MSNLINTLGKDGLKNAYTLLQQLALWTTVALAVIIIVSYLIFKYKLNNKLSSFKTVTFGIVIGYAITISTCIMFFMIARLIVKGEIDKNFYLLLGFFALCLLFCLFALITSFISLKAFKLCKIIGVILLIIYSIFLLCFLPTTSTEYQPLSTVGMYVFSFSLIIIIAILTIIFGKNKGSSSQTKTIAYAGICIALSFALSYVKLFSLPQGGSITLASTLPLIIYSYIFGARKGVFVCIIYGLLQCLQNPQIYQPMQVLIDYPVAFGAVGVSGITRNFKCLNKPLWQFVIGATLGLFLRYLAHFISGYYVFSSWAMEGYSALSWSLVYNLYVIVDLAIVLFVGIFLFSSKAFNNQLNLINQQIDESQD